MAVTSVTEAIRVLHEPQQSQLQISALRYLRNEAVGRQERKQFLVRLGLLDGLSACLAHLPNKGKTSSRNGAPSEPAAKQPLSEDEEVRNQVGILCSNIAHGGHELVVPMVASSVVPHLLSIASPIENHSKVVTSALLALSGLSRGLGSLATAEALAGQIFTAEGVKVLIALLSLPSPSLDVQRQVDLTCETIWRTIRTEEQRNMLAASGVLDLLGARLAAYYVSQHFWSPRANKAVKAALPPAPRSESLIYIFEAVTCIVGKSSYRIARLLYSPVLASIMTLNSMDTASELLMTYTAQNQTGGRQSNLVNLVDAHLPRMPSSGARDAFSKQFPALGSIQTSAKYSALMDFAESVSHTPDKNGLPNASESTMISWLVFTIRNEDDPIRLRAAALLTNIARAGFLGRSRDRMLALLVVPLLVDMIDQPVMEFSSNPVTSKTLSNRRDVQELAPKILSQLIRDSPMLQKAAVDCGADLKALTMLKKTFRSLEALPTAWSPDADTDIATDDSASRTLGPSVLRKDVEHLMKCREASLVLLAAICEKEDNYRDPLIDKGLVTLITESLIPMTAQNSKDLSGNAKIEKLDVSMGNPLAVLLAACAVARSLSRSPRLLRTSLIDNGLAAPTFALLKHENPQVLIAASDVVCNVVMEFSPMREDLVKFGVIKTLCEHSHSADTQIRLVSLWALKHLVHKAPNDIRLTCFEQLGTTWLIQIISGNSSTSATASRSSKASAFTGAANSIGERIDILNAAEDELMDLSTNDSHSSRNPQVTNTATSSENSMIPAAYSHIPDLIPLATLHTTKLQSIRYAEELGPAQRLARDELQIQIQGLDFIRNLIQGPGVHDMVDQLFERLGSARLFDLITSKIRPSATSPMFRPNMPSASSGPQWSQPPEILASTLFVLVHLAAGHPKHRQLIVQQRGLLSALLAVLTGHPDAMAKTPAILAVQNLVWIDDREDRPRVKEACTVLHSLGFEDAIDRLRGDPTLDVRERAATAYRGLIDGLRGIRSSSSGRDQGSAGSVVPGSTMNDLRRGISGR